MKKHFFINRGTSMEPEIYLDDKIFLGGFNEMLVYIFSNYTKGKVFYSYKGFNKSEINGINSCLFKFCQFFNENINHNAIVESTHALKIKVTDSFFLDDIAMLLKVLSTFMYVDSIEYKNVNDRKMVIVNGRKVLHGILCDDGFYCIETGEFFEKNCLNKKEIAIFNHVSKYGIPKKKTIYKS